MAISKFKKKTFILYIFFQTFKKLLENPKSVFIIFSIPSLSLFPSRKASFQAFNPPTCNRRSKVLQRCEHNARCVIEHDSDVA
ncbi:hypothetical protein E1A91_A05G211000v1 [Gossypium mustelinum]|uniref:Uncharacterized protein n=2 Tax=Gossypium TaxID=3633 RepID=A0A5D2ZA69_GOSMU|nr:hypothetical protein ES332_A05G214000v1 [Gossypium tomentosum]TYJ35064.1 hypothetical protein E1A91_A05G211000v1 [Gossypium mustelinum]